MFAARLLAGKLLGIVTQALSSVQAWELIKELEATAKPGDGKPQRFEQQQGSLMALGYVCAQTCTGKAA